MKNNLLNFYKSCTASLFAYNRAMSYNPTKYPQGAFCWADFYSTDIEASKKFMNELFGWTSEDMPTGDGMPDYTMFSLDDKNTAGGSPTFGPDMPSFWSNYITVDNVDDITAKAEKLGAKVQMKPMDVLDSGRMSTIQDPTGAAVSLWQPKKHIGAGVVNTVGAMGWNELYTPDIETSKKFYTDLFGWTYETDEENDGYITILNNGRMNGGMMAISSEMTGMIPSWMVYFSVKNIDEAAKKVEELGGEVHLIKEVNVGKLAMVADPAKTNFLLIEMSVTPEEWKD